MELRRLNETERAYRATTLVDGMFGVVCREGAWTVEAQAGSFLVVDEVTIDVFERVAELLDVSSRPARWCCFVPCGAAAEFELWHQCGHPECHTDACADHVGAMVGCSHPEVGRPDAPTTVTAIGGEG